MKYSDRQALFFFDQYFSVRLGENTYPYRKGTDNFTMARTFAALLRTVLSRIPPNRTLKDRLYGRHLFYVETVNQLNSIRGLVEKLGDNSTRLMTGWVLNEPFFAGRLGIDSEMWPMGHQRWKSMEHIIKAFRISAWLRRKYKGQVAHHHIVINLAQFLAAVDTCDFLIRELKPRSVTVINDHNVVPLAWLLSARRSGVPTVYIQHAAVSAVFPKLLANWALLEGQHAADTYSRIGSYARQTRLVGIPRLDGRIGFHGDAKLSGELTVGLCLKTFYSDAQIRDLFDALKKSPKVVRIILRPHPGSPAEYMDRLRTLLKEDISDGRTEEAIRFLERVDVLVSGESTIILEAALMKIPAIHFDDGSFFFPFDFYGLVKNEVAYCTVSQPGKLTEIVSNLSAERVAQNFSNTKYYCSTIGTDREGKSLEILAGLFQQIGQ